MSIMEFSEKRALEDIVLALRKPKQDQNKSREADTVRVGPRHAAPRQVRDLESAIDDVMKRFPQTLDYLAK